MKSWYGVCAVFMGYFEWSKMYAAFKWNERFNKSVRKSVPRRESNSLVQHFESAAHYCDAKKISFEFEEIN